MKVFGRVLVFGRVAATDVPAFHAQSEVYPSVAHLQALLAAFGVRRYFVNVAQVRASAHDLPTPLSPASIRDLAHCQPTARMEGHVCNDRARPKDA
jgi:hypothetical protein